MTRAQLMTRVRSLTRDFTNSVFRENDINDFINEGINRTRQIIPELELMPVLGFATDSLVYLPVQYHHLIAVYATARCFAQDERNYQASTYMNEFEVKMEELKMLIEAGKVIILDTLGVPIVNPIVDEYVRLDNYYNVRVITVLPEA